MILGNYNGGKGRLYQKLINLMPPHQTYIEPFLGGGSVALHKRPAQSNIIIDKDHEVITAWRKHIEDIASNGEASAPSQTTVQPGIIIGTPGHSGGSPRSKRKRPDVTAPGCVTAVELHRPWRIRPLLPQQPIKTPQTAVSLHSNQ